MRCTRIASAELGSWLCRVAAAGYTCGVTASIRCWHSSASYSIEGFWTASQDVGFEPLYVTLVPRQPELNESRYAYFALKK